MPEGHTLHRLARAQRDRFAGHVVAVSSPQGRFEAGAALVDGRRLVDVTAYGKHLFAAFGDRIVHVHLGLFGRVVEGPGDPPPPIGAVRMRWVAESGWSDLRGPTACEVLSPPEVELILDRLGPDPLRPSTQRLLQARSSLAGRGPSSEARTSARPLSRDVACARIARSRAPIGGLLMDQRVIAGVGNVYRAEVLFRRRLDPYLPGRDVGRERWAALWTDLGGLMRQGVRTGRIVTTERADRERSSGRVRAEDAHYVYRRTGLPCRVCGSPIVQHDLAGRKLYFCAVCQAP